MKEGLSYGDVLLTPRFSNIESRSQVDIGNSLGEGLHFKLPVISSPMDTVTESAMALTMHNKGGLAIVHRYNEVEDQVKHVALALANDPDLRIGAAIGMTGDYELRALALRSVGAKVLCIDVAHGHHAVMERCLKTLKDRLGDTVHLMAGNVATLEGFDALASWGADSIRVGIGGGSICSTRLVTGHGVPTFQSLLEISQTTYSSKIIADGGIKTTGDMVKAFAAGADFVMIGSMLAGTKETPGEIFSSNSGKKYKVYRGMASSDAQVDWRGKSSTPEGISTTIPYKGSAETILENISGGIRSGLSYSGVHSLAELRCKATFIRQTNSSQLESSTHILGRGV
jgi:IMP dehydrogenase